MGVKIKQRAARPERRTVEIPGLEGCTLTVREPTDRERYAQYIHANRVVKSGDMDEWQAATWDYRLRVIVGWSGFDDDNGNPLPFSREWLRTAMQQVDALQTAAVRAANDSFAGIDEGTEKNSVTPSGNGSTEPVADVPTV